MIITDYSANNAEAWNEFIATSKNGTFLFNRGFMDYHADRFRDCSVMFMDKGKIMAVFPASFDSESQKVSSHGGLTYGGLIMHPTLTQTQVLECFELLLKHYRDILNAKTITYKAIPHIYSRYTTDEDLYALYRNNASLVSRGASQCISLSNKLRMSELRRRNIKKAIRADIKVETSKDAESFWSILNEVLTSRHSVNPVHTADEMRLLESRFPDNIKLYTAKSSEGNILAGAWVFITDNVVHTQYLASSAEGKESGALDIIIETLIREYSDKKYLDFGISTEDGGKYLNEGLTFQKEGFGGRCVCYDVYEIGPLTMGVKSELSVSGLID